MSKAGIKYNFIVKTSQFSLKAFQRNLPENARRLKALSDAWLQMLSYSSTRNEYIIISTSFARCFNDLILADCGRELMYLECRLFTVVKTEKAL